jgi:ankyrin repeat protein
MRKEHCSWIYAYGLERYYRFPYRSQPLSFAASEGLTAVVQQLLQTNRDLRDLRGDYERALQGAAQQGFVLVIRTMLDQERSDLAAMRIAATFALPAAAIKGHAVVMRVLVDEYPANVNGTNDLNRTALFLAIREGH